MNRIGALYLTVLFGFYCYPSQGQNQITNYVLPHFAVGDGWRTTVYLQPIQDGGTVELILRSPSGVTWRTESRKVDNRDQILKIVFDDSLSVHLATGSIQIRCLDTMLSDFRYAVFTNNLTKQEATHKIAKMDYPAGGAGAIQVLVDHLDSYATGIAVFNPSRSTTAAEFEVSFWDQGTKSGEKLGRFSLKAGEQLSISLTERFPSLRDRLGIIRIQPPLGLTTDGARVFMDNCYSMAFRFSPFGSFTSLTN